MRTFLTVTGFLAVVAVLVLVVDPVNAAAGHVLSGDVDSLREQLHGLGGLGALLIVALILVHAVVLFPAEVVNAAAGLVYGFGLALPLVMAAWIASGLLAYWLGARAGRPLALRLAGERRVLATERLLDRGGAPVLLVARLIPFIPYSLLGYVAGAAHVPLWRYTWTSALGVLPITAAATYLGHALDDLSASDPLLWLSAAVITGLIVLTAVAGRRTAQRSTK